MIWKNSLIFNKKKYDIELKNILIHKISAINDVSFLKAIQTIVDSKMNHEVLPLTPEQKDEIIASKKEVEEDFFLEDTNCMKKLTHA